MSGRKPPARKGGNAATNERSPEQKERKHWLEYATAFLALLAAVGSVTAAIFSGWQAFIAREAERNQLRAYVSVSDFSVACCDTDVEARDYQERRKLATIVIRNGGQTPASAVVVAIGYTEYRKGQPFPDRLVYSPLSISGKIEMLPNGIQMVRPASYYILQGETKTAQMLLNVMQMIRTKNRLTDTVLFGTITYADIFGRHNAVDFCRIWEALSDGTDRYDDCPEHNAAHE
jgi:hypothetical protein